MRKLFILSLLAMMIAIGGCGSGGTSADPLGTDSIMFADAAGSVAPQVNPNGAVSLKATVKNAFGTAVVGREVSFTIVSNASGATLASSTANTDGAGEATILYTAGTTAGSDVVRASISNGANMDVNITVGGGGGATAYAVSVSASATSVTAGQVSIITATVTGGSTAAGVSVSFTLPVNSSGAILSAATATTDGNGKAVVVYQPGTNTPTIDVQDTVQAAVGTATGAVPITRTGSAATTTTPYAVTIGASAGTGTTPMTAGQVSIITATVTGGSTAAGVSVSFTLPVNSSGATLSAATATTDSKGNAVVIYQPGITSPTLSVQDAVQAAVGTATSAVALTRSGSSTSTYGITVTAAPATLSIIGGNSVITANVKNNLGTVVSGVTVNFTVTGAATVLPLSAITDVSGNAVTIFTGDPGSLTTETDVATASITDTVSGNNYTAAVVITNP